MQIQLVYAIPATAVALLAIGFGGAALAGMFQSPQSRLTEACGVALQERLVSPSSYNLLDATEVRFQPYSTVWEVGNGDEEKGRSDRATLERSDDEFVKEVLAYYDRMERDGYRVASTILKYESMNRLGVLLVGYSRCELVLPDENIPRDIRSSSVVIDGQNNGAWRLSG